MNEPCENCEDSTSGQCYECYVLSMTDDEYFQMCLDFDKALNQ